MATFVYDGSRLNALDMPVGGPFDIFEAFSMNVLGTLGNDNFDVTGILQYIGNNTFILESGNDTLRGSDEGEAIYGGNGNDDLAGNGGNDWIGGGDGDDTVSAGSGNDTLISSNGNDLYFGGAGDDVFSYDGNSFKTLILDAAASIEILDAFSMTVLGTLGDDLFDVTGILQYVKSNTFSLESGNDTLRGSELGENIYGGADNDSLFGNGENDWMSGGDGQDTLYGGTGTDTLNGDAGDDFLYGGSAETDLRDVIYGGGGNDWADGGAGNDEISGGSGRDTLVGGLGSDTLIGNEDNDLLSGTGGSDAMFGNDGDDYLNGGFGYDRLNGGAGADRFFHLGVADHGSDWIQDYRADENDVLMAGIAGAQASDFHVNIATTPGAGDAGVAEAFVVYIPGNQILWALVDGGAQTSINVQIGGQVFDLLA